MNTMKDSLKIGVDIGNVIIGGIINNSVDTSFISNDIEKAMETLPVPGAFEAIEKLVEHADGSVWLVSKAHFNTMKKTDKWLRHWKFFKKTGLAKDNVWYCLERIHKAVICKGLELTHFIDDRLDVLAHLKGIVPNLYLFGEQPYISEIPDWVTHVSTWNELETLITNS